MSAPSLRFHEFSALEVLTRIEVEAERYFVGAFQADEEKPCLLMVRARVTLAAWFSVLPSMWE
jgi:hypothetical protein